MLTELKLKNIKFSEKVTLYADADGLFLRVSKTKMRWLLTFFKGKKYQFYGGEYPAVTLKEARTWAAQTRSQAIENVQIDGMYEFSIGYFFEQYRKQQVKRNRAENTIKKMDMRKNKYLTPVLNRDVRSFTPKDVLAILEPIGDAKKYEAQNQVRELLSNIFLHTTVLGLRETNPVDNLYKILGNGEDNEVSRAAITKPMEFGQLVFDIYKAEETSQMRPTTLKALKFLPHTFVRSENLYTMEWTEIDARTKTWHIPREKMKGKEAPLDVPLTKQSWEIIQEAKALKKNSKWVFGSWEINKKTKKMEDTPLNSFSLRNALINLGYFGAHMDKEVLPENPKFHSPHGFRASARTIMDEVLVFRVDVIEHQLGHVVRDVNGEAYNRTKHWDKRVQMMQLWSNFIEILKEGSRRDIDAFIKEHKGAI